VKAVEDTSVKLVLMVVVMADVTVVLMEDMVTQVVQVVDVLLELVADEEVVVAHGSRST